MMPSQMDVSIIFVNYFTSELLKKCIDSIIDKTKDVHYEIIIVDNSNDDEEFSKLTNVFNKYKLINPHENLGFGKANNLGAKYANGKYLFFLNADTILVNNAIKKLLDFIDNHQDTAIVGPNLFTLDLKPYHSYRTEIMDLKWLKKDNSILAKLIEKIKNKRADFNYTSEPIEIHGYICGAALMIRKQSFNELNGFDKHIFMYGEEALLCYEIIQRKIGRIYNIPDSKIIHLEGGSFKKINEKLIPIFIDGNYNYYKIAFGKEYANKYLKDMKKYAKKKVIVSKITNDGYHLNKYKLMIEAIDNFKEE